MIRFTKVFKLKIVKRYLTGNNDYTVLGQRR